jgi:hypothetical protein
MFCFDFELHLAAFTNPVVLAFDEGVKMNSFTVIGRADVTLHAPNSLASRISSVNSGT